MIELTIECFHSTTSRESLEQQVNIALDELRATEAIEYIRKLYKQLAPIATGEVTDVQIIHLETFYRFLKDHPEKEDYDFRDMRKPKRITYRTDKI